MAVSSTGELIGVCLNGGIRRNDPSNYKSFNEKKTSITVFRLKIPKQYYFSMAIVASTSLPLLPRDWEAQKTGPFFVPIFVFFQPTRWMAVMFFSFFVDL